MGVDVRSAEGEVWIRCTGWYRSSGIAVATGFGVFTVGSAATALTEHEWAAAVFVGLFGLGLVHCTLAWSAATVVANRDGLRSRSGLLRRRVAAADLTEIRVVGPDSQSRVVLVVTRATGRPRRVKTVQQICTTRNRRALESAAVEVNRALRGHAYNVLDRGE